MRSSIIAFALCLAAVPTLAQDPCGPVDHAAVLAEAWLKREPAKSPGKDLSMREATCVQAALVQRLSAAMGKAIGYKAGLTSPTAQQQIGVPHPVTGVLLEKMILKDGATVPANFGPRPLFEADMLVTVRDAAVNQAKTPLEIARHLSTLQPFIELPDLVLAQGEPMTGPVIVAINVGARLGVAGAPRPIQATPEFVDALADMQVVLTADGQEVSRAPGKIILGHPLNAVIYLAEEMQRRGSPLKAGDVLSLGSFSRLTPPKPGQKVTARYEGLPTGPMTVSVAFE